MGRRRFPLLLIIRFYAMRRGSAVVKRKREIAAIIQNDPAFKKVWVLDQPCARVRVRVCVRVCLCVCVCVLVVFLTFTRTSAERVRACAESLPTHAHTHTHASTRFVCCC